MFESDVETEQNNIAVLHHILLALGANQTLFAGSSQRAKLDEILIVDNLSANEAALEVGVNLAGSLRRLCALLDGPRADLCSPAVR